MLFPRAAGSYETSTPFRKSCPPLFHTLHSDEADKRDLSPLWRRPAADLADRNGARRFGHVRWLGFGGQGDRGYVVRLRKKPSE